MSLELSFYSFDRPLRAQDSQHALAVSEKDGLALACEAADRQGHLAFELLFDRDVPGFFQLGEVAGQVALRESTLALKIQEVRFGFAENGHGGQARGFMDEAVDLGDVLQSQGHGRWRSGMRAVGSTY